MNVITLTLNERQIVQLKMLLAMFHTTCHVIGFPVCEKYKLLNCKIASLHVVQGV